MAVFNRTIATIVCTGIAMAAILYLCIGRSDTSSQFSERRFDVGRSSTASKHAAEAQPKRSVAPTGGVRTALLPRPYAPISQHYFYLAEAARAGNARAACRLAVDLADCAASHKTIRAIDAIARTSSAVNDDGTASRMISALETTRNSSEMCGGVTDQMELSAYDFQKLAASLQPKRYADWLASNPSLDRESFVSRLREWNEYHAFAENHFESALKSKDLRNLPLLIMVFAPDTVGGLRPPYRRPDTGIFLALYGVAKTQNVPVPTEIAAEAQRLMVSGERPRQSALNYGWKGAAPKSLGEVYLRMHPKPMMSDYCE
jgi:hypothetical protein